jgi:hypothetical protein
MVLQTWIVPEPDPCLRIDVGDIDIYSLNYEDIRYICSSSMNQYYDEFRRLPNFIHQANKVIVDYETKKRQNYISPPPIKRTLTKTPIKVSTPLEINKHKLLPVVAGKTNYKKTLEQYEKYLVTRDKKSEACIIN